MSEIPGLTSKPLAGRLVLVTGGARGIGAAISREVAAQGAQVIVADLLQDEASELAGTIVASGGSAAGRHLDVSDRAQAIVLAAQVRAEFGPIAVLINNAGNAVAAVEFVDASSPAIWDRTIAINLTGTLNVTHAFLGQLTETRGSVVNLSSVTSFTSGTSNAGYAAAKAGINSLTRQLARELAGLGIRVNCVAPGYCDTGKDYQRSDKMSEFVRWHCPMQRHGTPAEIARPVAFLASDAASFITGAVLPVDGGFLTI